MGGIVRWVMTRTECILYAAPDTPEHTQEAIEYARSMGLTQETTRIYKHNEQVLVSCHKIPESLEGTWLWKWLKTHLE